MRLKTLEVKGLKSFAESTVVHFNENITGIVGPNGCGKSNIIDAIRWVLGEQKPSKLRVEKMEDLVFNGTKNRKPCSMAEVSLTFENTKNILSTEYSMVSIKRILYRGGDSEYRINDVTCRLKDIQNLFLDTGVNADSYAIIELAMVDDLLKDIDNSRRKIFEQAAGISKYKLRKKETLNKLSSTDIDLNRILDLLMEIETNLAALGRQAKRTQQYYKLKETYRDYSIQYAVLVLKSFKNDRDVLIRQEEEELNKKRKVESELLRVESQLDKLKRDAISYEQSLSTSQRSLNEFLDILRAKESQKSILKQGIEFINERKANLIDQNTKNTEALHVIDKSIKAIFKTIDTEATCLSDLDLQLREVTLSRNNSEIYMQEKSEALLHLQHIYKNTEQQFNDLEKNIAVSQSQKNNNIKNIQVRKDEADTKTKELDELKVKMTEALAQKKCIEENLYIQQNQEEMLQNRILELKHKIDVHRQLLNDENRSLTSLQAEYNLIKRLVDNMEGYPDSIKYLKQKHNPLRHAPLLGDIIRCDESHKSAIETILDHQLHYFIVETWEDAYQAINVLDEKQKGRANFFILEELDNITIKSFDHKGYTPLLSKIETDSKYVKLVQYLLGHVILVDETWDRSERINTLSYVTMDGKYFSNTITLSGGAIGIFKGSKLGKSRELENLKKEIQSQVSKMDNIENIIYKHQDEITQLNQQSQSPIINETISQYNQSSNRVLQLQTQIEQYQNFLNNYDLQFNTLEEEIILLDSQIACMQTEYYSTQTRRNDEAMLVQNANTDFIISSNKYNELKDQYNQINLNFHQQENRLNNFRSELQYKNEQINSLQQGLDENTTHLNQLLEEITQKEYEQKILEDELQIKYLDKDKLELQVNSKEQDFYNIRNQISDLEKQAKDKSKNKELSDTQLNALKDKANELKFQYTSVHERLQIEFNLNINDILNHPEFVINENADVDELKNNVAAQRKRLENFGEFNPMAVEAYNEMKIRYDNIVAQKHDLEMAKNYLLQTIREIDAVAKENFMDAFVKIRENFIRVFRSLFIDEDQCDLLLENPDDPLESPIVIIAKPKGKRPQNISQLSGGERALTATALLFSIYLLKPAPFCIFDEVDAPLDDTNIDKFNKIIKEFSNNSQFIVVTHNKITMTAVDVIYGVTMAEQGVSKLVPVDFRHLN